MLIFFSSYLTVLLCVVSNVENKVCSSVDIRNSPDNILEYSDCKVIEGNLQIVLMENVDDTSFTNKSLSQLYEVTGRVTIFRLDKLKSLGLLLPKLTTIGGNNLLANFALILYDLPDLKEISLTSLRKIKHGGVKIGKCPNLCYGETVNWEAIGAADLTVDMPGFKNESCRSEFCLSECDGYCWNSSYCQRYTENKCHPLCIGCSKDNSPLHCNSCKYFNNTGTCVKTCPPSKVVDNYGGRCLDPPECVTKVSKNPEGSSFFWSIFGDSCIEKCPALYERSSNGTCTYTGRKLCQGITINDANELRSVTNCTHINASLALVLNTNYILPIVLEKALGQIVIISGYLKIARSKAITTLDFFKSLKRITGETVEGSKSLWSGHYALYVVQNPNLQKLFGSNVSIGRGEAIFQDNPNLCPYEIENLKNVTTNMSNYNGYETNCTLIKLNVSVVQIGKNANLTWAVPKQPWRPIGYIVYYVAEVGYCNENTIFIKKNCLNEQVDFGWSNIFVSNTSVHLRALSPASCYFYYIRILFTPHHTLQTEIYHFETDTGNPSDPLHFEAFAQNDTTIKLNWSPPTYHYGQLSYYKLAVYFEKDYIPTITQRNYCIRPHRICNCSVQEEIRAFVANETCLGQSGPHYCNNKTSYVTTDYMHWTILDFNDAKNGNQNFTIPTNDSIYNISILMRFLKPFTMYTFYVRACNKKKANESEHCSDAAVTFQRTLERKTADLVKDINITRSGRRISVNWSKPDEPNSVVVAYHLEYKRKGVIHSVSKSKCFTSWQNKPMIHENNEQKLIGLESGKYLLRILTVSLAGPGEWSEWQAFEIPPKNSISRWWYIFLGVLGLVTIIVLMLIIYRRYKTKYEIERLVHSLSQRHGFVAENEEWKIDDETVEIVRELDQNSVGVLYRNFVVN